MQPEVSERFGMERSNSVRNPIVPDFKITKNEGGVRVDVTQYKQMVGSLMYVTVTRPDLMFVVSLVSRYMEKLTELHMQTIKRILRHVRGTVELGVCYKEGANSGEELVAFSNSDYAGNVDDRRSTSGYVFMLSNGVVAWSSKKQPVVTLSTIEAEFISAASYACQGVWMRRVLENLGCKQSKSTIIFCDNSSTIKLSRNPVMHDQIPFSS
ncbi:secreted RxLR effector protein 161-like [Rosa chinensis]|uniref:secreted RxLR effector protein 161-like n=1 Tax=Rosa chinensis TaxID=74649 RepID=UPI001AD8A911|nr:secreted RxLR effector protein 161-like [Rosa chinensis]